jgi:hypothetical protein
MYGTHWRNAYKMFIDKTPLDIGGSVKGEWQVLMITINELLGSDIP